MQFSMQPATSYDNDANFKSFFKGIVIKSNTNHNASEGAVFALIVDDNLSKIAIHYNDSLQYDLHMKSSRKFANYEIVESKRVHYKPTCQFKSGL